MKLLFASLIVFFSMCETMNVNSIDFNKSYVTINHRCETPETKIDSAFIYIDDEFIFAIAKCEKTSFNVEKGTKITAKYKMYTVNQYYLDSITTTDTIMIFHSDTIQTKEWKRNWIITADTTKWSLIN